MVTSSDAYAALVELGRPVITTADVARLWGTKLDTTTHALTRLSRTGLVRRIRHGIWKVGPGRADPRDVLPVLTGPYPSYISYWSALFQHGMIEQIPAAVHAASLDRPKRIHTTDDDFNIRPVHPDLFGGMEGQTGIRAGVATPEKALFDTVYLLVPRGGQITLPELELPRGFNERRLWSWLERVPTSRLRSLTRSGLERVLAAERIPA